MNENEVSILRRWQTKLVDALHPNLYLIANFLYGEGVLEQDECLRIVETTDEKRECIKLLLILPKKCSLNKLLEAMRIYTPEHFQSLNSELIQSFPMSTDIVKAPLQSDDTKTGGRMIEIFRDKLMGKVLNAEVLQHSDCLRNWLPRLLKSLENSNVPLRQRRSIADCCFVITDTLTVIERTHSADKKSLWKSEMFIRMKGLISDTSNPSQTAIRYQARYGAALALGGKRELGKEYVETAMQDAFRVSKGRDLGNCVFALVNIKLQEYTGEENEKKSILDLIEIGNDQYANENEELRTKWRQVYLDKKVFCHLGIDVSMNDIMDSQVSEDDISEAFKCLNEMEQYVGKMDKRRYMHYLRGRSKYHFLKHDDEIATGYLKGAIKEGQLGGFVEEVNTMNKLICSTDQDTTGNHPLREPVENYEEQEVNSAWNNNNNLLLYQRSEREPVENIDSSEGEINDTQPNSNNILQLSVPVDKMGEKLLEFDKHNDDKHNDLINSNYHHGSYCSQHSSEELFTLKQEMCTEPNKIVEAFTHDIAEKLSMETPTLSEENNNEEEI